MSRLLTIAIPTFNRAQQLERQLAWIDRNLAGVETMCEVIVSDNASSDETTAVCRRWKVTLAARGVDVHVNRREINLGPLPNIAYCIEHSTSRFTWVIGDDDDIHDGTIAFVIARLQAHPDLASIVLNFQGVGLTRYDRCFQLHSDQLGPGKHIMSELLRQNYWGLAFMTAQVYRTEFAHQALLAWPEGMSNYDFQIFISAFVAMHGETFATSATHVKYVTGENIYETDKRIALRLYADSLEVFGRLSKIGYDPRLCRSLAMHHLWSLKRRFVTRALTNNPVLTLRTLGRATGYLAQLALASPAAAHQ